MFQVIIVIQTTCLHIFCTLGFLHFILVQSFHLVHLSHTVQLELLHINYTLMRSLHICFQPFHHIQYGLSSCTLHTYAFSAHLFLAVSSHSVWLELLHINYTLMHSLHICFQPFQHIQYGFQERLHVNFTLMHSLHILVLAISFQCTISRSVWLEFLRTLLSARLYITSLLSHIKPFNNCSVIWFLFCFICRLGKFFVPYHKLFHVTFKQTIQYNTFLLKK